MKTILLGPNGQLGSDIFCTNRREGEPLSIKPIDRSVIDLTDLDTTSRFLRDEDFECLINCSSYHKTDEVEQNPTLAYKINADLVCMLSKICAEKNARLVHVSTDYVFGGQQKRQPLTELDAKAPINVYGASKSMGEDFAMRSG